ncbi:pentapeptide repeat-containing protein [Streptomyces tirandamycinicus]|uniref:pentapeptide repeat-containing protein n=1 Tax=Streptomyces tirandamycinicus TaxID=2174846 RepID=UPI001FC9FE7C|nr:pentapeptide repeat-containing protein [Streptomyces tirandamycinicus]
MDWARRIELVTVVVAAVVAVAGLWYSNVQAREQRATEYEGQITDRYTAAVENLGDDAIDVRLGGIYALQRIMQDSVRDHPTIVNVLTAYIRSHAPLPEAPRRSAEAEDQKKEQSKPTEPDADVQAALSVLGRRNPIHDAGRTWIDLHRADLRGADLSSADLSSADLRGADLRGATLGSTDLSGADLLMANLRGADLDDADLSSADLRGTDLTGAGLRAADLTGAELSSADLRDADLRGAGLRDAGLRGADLRAADLTGADLSSADLTGADLRGADLRGANLRNCRVSAGQVAAAVLNAYTRLPSEIASDPKVWERAAHPLPAGAR